MDIINILIGGGILAFLQFLISRYDRKHDKQKAVMEKLGLLEKKINVIDEKIDEREATLARTHILRFSDELYNGIHHSKEYFDQTLEDIDTYDAFCDTHPEYRNSRTTHAVMEINETYKRLYNEHKF